MSESFAHHRFLCRTLSPFTREGGIDELCQQAGTGEIDWGQVITIANRNWIGAALWTAVRNKGLDGYLPGEARDYLEELHALNLQRNEHLKRQAVEIIRALNQRGIVPLLIKGTAQLFHPVYPSPGDRVMNDLDIVVPHEDFDAALNGLYALDYREASDYPASHAPSHHWIPLVRDWEYGSVELHRDPVHERAAHVMPTAEMWQGAVELRTAGATLKIPSPTQALLIGFLHTAIKVDNAPKYYVDLKWLADFAGIVATDQERIDWAAIDARCSAKGLASVWRAQLMMGKRLWVAPAPSTAWPGWLAQIYARLCLAMLHYGVFARFTQRFGEPIRIAHAFSASNICRRYACEARVLPLTINRLRLFCYYVFEWFWGQPR